MRDLAVPAPGGHATPDGLGYPAGAGGGNTDPFEAGDGYVGQSEEPKYRELAARLERAIGMLRCAYDGDGCSFYDIAALLAEHEQETRP